MCLKNSTFDESSRLPSSHRTPEARSPPHNPFQSPQGPAGGSLSKAGSGESSTQEYTKLQVYVYVMSGELRECSRPYSEAKGVCVLTQLCQQSLLQLAQVLLNLLHRRKDLDGADKQVLTEGKTQDVDVVPTVTERAVQGHEHWRSGKIDHRYNN